MLSRLFSTAQDGDSLLWNAFLRFNLMISLGVSYRTLLHHVAAFRTWAPLVLRWLARLMFYEFLWFLAVEMFYSLFHVWDTRPLWFVSLTLSLGCVARHIVYDVRKQAKPAFARMP
jgi:hypothetical protein